MSKCLCRVCGEAFSPKRRALGYETCLNHGHQDAARIAEERNKSVMPLGNKMGFGLITGKTEKERRAEVLGRTGKGQI